MLARTQRGSSAVYAMSRRTFINKLLGYPSKRVTEIVEKQDEYKEDQKAPITILNRENSPKFEAFDAERDMPDFKIVSWKNHFVKQRDLEATYTHQAITDAISETYTETYGKSLTPEQFGDAYLNDLPLRFQLCKALQQKLGFDISDYVISRSYNVEYLSGTLKKMVSTRWSNERNPNAIVLRSEDFKQPNVYLNKELDDYQQKQYFETLKKDAAEQPVAQ